MPDRFDVVQAFTDLDEGTITPRTYLELHAHMIRDGSAWSVPGRFGRTAAGLIEGGYITSAGEITQKGRDAVIDAEEGQDAEKAREEALAKSQEAQEDTAQEDTAQEQRELWEASDDLRGGPFGIVPPEVGDEIE
jgi:hypothetical protein